MSTPLFVDHSPLDAFANALAQDPGRINNKQQEEHFWSTPTRPATSPVQETLEVVLTGPRLVNVVEFETARYPHTVTVQHWDATAKQWVAVVDAYTGGPARTSVLSSIPSILPNQTAVPGHLHPQHAYAGHWELLTFQIKPTDIQRLRIILQRTTKAPVPRDTFGNPVDYSLAVMNLRLGYRVVSRDDVPRSPLQADSLTTREVFAGTDDLLGSSLQYALRENLAASILNNTSSDPQVVWRSEPQPFPQAVVNFYADLRDRFGAGQVLDRIYMDPLNNGPHVSVYFNSDESDGNFDPANDPLTAAQAALVGKAFLVGDHLHLGNYGEEASVRIDNNFLMFEPNRPWWLGLRVRPTFVNGADSNEHPIWDCERFRLSGTPTGFQILTNQNESVSVELPYVPGVDTLLLASFDGTNLRLRAVSQFGDVSNSLDLIEVLSTGALPVMSLGRDIDNTLLGGWDVYDLVLKDETLASDDFLSRPDAYSTVARFATEDNGLQYNALLRLDTGNALLSPARPSGLFGGPASKYDSMVWTPVLRDYTMQKGWMYLPEIRAKYVKLEITNLVPTYHDVHLPTQMTVRTFPPDIIADFQAQNTRERSRLPEEAGVRVSGQLRGATAYRDFPLYISTGLYTKGYTNTQAYVVDDYDTANRLHQQYGASWNFLNWHPSNAAPRWSQNAVHRYRVQTIERTTKIGFYAGLRYITFARTLSTGRDDAGQYETMFYDLNQVVSTNWVYDPDNRALWLGNSTKAQATSIVYGSTRNLRGIQFSAAQSQPIQMLADPDFTDPIHRNWTPVGDATLTIEQSDSPLIGTALQVDRAVRLGYWADIPALYPTWGDIVAAGATYADLSLTTNHPETMGGLASETVTQPIGGRLYAAARAVASTDLNSPLWVQIYDPSKDKVLAEEPASLRKDQITEWYTSYTVGDGGQIHPNTWADLVNGGSSTTWPSFSDTFARPDATTLGRMDSGQTWQDGASGGLHLVSGAAKVTVAGQSSSFDSQTPWGTLQVTLGTTVTAGSPSASVLLLDLAGCFQLFNDGRVAATTVDNSATSLFTPTAGDVLKFEFLPTKSVPSAHLPGGTDPVLTPAAMVFTRNGTWVTTFLDGREFTTVKALAGAVGQIFTAFSWVPDYAQIPTGNFFEHLPMPNDGALSTDGDSWTTTSGDVWYLTGTWTFSDGPSYTGTLHNAQPTSTGASSVVHDVGTPNGYGTLVFNVVQLAATVSTTSYNVMVLDQDGVNDLYLRANGDLVRLDGTVVKAGILPTVTGPTAVLYVHPAQLSSAFRTAHSIPSTDTQALIFMQGGTVVGTVSGTALWDSGYRGIAGYNDGAGDYTIHQGIAWGPDMTDLALDTRTVTWQDLTKGGTVSWADLVDGELVNLDAVQVRVVQKLASDDAWLMDSAALFHDPIVWEFSQDGAKTFYPAYEIRADPNGVLLFPPPDPTLNPQPARNQLAWRVSTYAPDSWVTHLVIRPWYYGMMRGVPVRFAFSPQGPNAIPYDHYPPIEQDPRFRIWHKPIPRDWWFAFRDPNNLDAAKWLHPVLSDALVYEPDKAIPVYTDYAIFTADTSLTGP